MLVATGARIGEVLALNVEHYDPVTKTLHIEQSYSLRFGIGPTKSHRSRRTISVPDILFPVLNAAVAGRTTGPLFPTSSGARRNAQAVWDAWQSITRVAKTPRVNLHVLRHSVATLLIAAGVPLPDAARFLGDTVATMVKCYIHPTWADPAHTLNRLYGVQRMGGTGPVALQGLEIKVFDGTA
jgi:integrase